MNPYNQNHMGSSYQPNQQYLNPQQQQYPQPQYAQAGPFYGQGQQQGEWRAPYQQGYYHNQQQQYYTNSQGQQACGNQGQNAPFYAQPGAGSPYAGANPNWQGAPGAFPQHPFSPFNNAQQMFTLPPAGFQNLAAPPQANYVPQSARGFSAPSYPYTPLQNYTTAPQYTPPAAIYQAPTPASAIPHSIPMHSQPQPEVVNPVVVNPVAEEGDSIDEDTLRSYIDYLTKRIDQNCSYIALLNTINSLKDLIKDSSDQDNQKTNLYYSKIIEEIYKKDTQPSRQLCAFILATSNDKQLSVDHFINYIQQEITQAKNAEDRDKQLEYIGQKIWFFSEHVQDVKDVIQLAHLIEDDVTRDDMIMSFIHRKDIAKNALLDPLIALLRTDTIDRYTYLVDKVVANPGKYLEAHREAIANSQHRNEHDMAKLYQLKTPLERLIELARQRYKNHQNNQDLISIEVSRKTPTIIIDTLTKFWNQEATNIETVLSISRSRLETDEDKEALGQHILNSERFANLSLLEKSLSIENLIRELPLKSKDLKDLYLKKIDQILIENTERYPHQLLNILLEKAGGYDVIIQKRLLKLAKEQDTKNNVWNYERSEHFAYLKQFLNHPDCEAEHYRNNMLFGVNGSTVKNFIIKEGLQNWSPKKNEQFLDILKITDPASQLRYVENPRKLAEARSKIQDVLSSLQPLPKGLNNLPKEVSSQHIEAIQNTLLPCVELLKGMTKDTTTSASIIHSLKTIKDFLLKNHDEKSLSRLLKEVSTTLNDVHKNYKKTLGEAYENNLALKAETIAPYQNGINYERQVHSLLNQYNACINDIVMTYKNRLTDSLDAKGQEIQGFKIED